jgi:putative transposase
MQKTVSLEYGKYYHIYHRGNNRENIFFEEKNFEYFLKLYVKYIVPVADTYAYCLMKNHFHFLVRIKTVEEQISVLTPEKQNSEVSKTSEVLMPVNEQNFEVSKTSEVLMPIKALNPTQQVSNLLNSYTKSINKAYQRVGSLFQGRFGRILVDCDSYFMYLVAYIHRNPEKHGFVDDFRTYPYSSYHAISHQKATHIKSEDVLGWFGNLDTFNNCHQTWDNEKQIVPLIVDD